MTEQQIIFLEASKIDGRLCFLYRPLPFLGLPGHETGLVVLAGVASYKTLLLDTLVNLFGLGVWTALAYKAAMTSALGLVSLQLYISVTANDKY